MISTALQDLFGGKAAEAVLLALFHQGEAYGRSIARLASRLRDLTGVAYDSLDPQSKQRIFAERRQPRAKDKPVIRG